LGETDDWAHAGAYPEYLNAAHLGDSYLRELWELVQSMPEYRGKTTLIVLPDHGRGVGPLWTSHGEKIPESKQTWMAFLGPDTPAAGRAQAGQAGHRKPGCGHVGRPVGRGLPRGRTPVGRAN
jgi:hypothetical protein